MKRLFRSLFTAGAIALGVQAVTVGVMATRFPDVVGGPEVQEARELRLPKAESLHLTSSNGSIRVRTHDLGEIELQADIRIYSRVRGKHDELASYAKSLVQVTAEGNSLKVITEPEGNAPYAADVTVDYVILVPEETHVTLRSVNGNVWVSKGCGNVDVMGQNTDIEISEPGGSVVAKSTNGRIRVTDAPAGATLDTVNGNVYAHMLGGTLSAVTVNGSIVAQVLDPHVEECGLKTQNGGITLVMHPECGAAVEAETCHGIVRCDMPIDGDPRPHRKRHLNATIGSGHTRVRMETLNGNIWIASNGDR